MGVAIVVLSLVMAAVAAFSAAGKLTRQPRVVDMLGSLNLAQSWLPPLAVALLVGAVGLVVGLAWTPLGVAAAVGLLAYFIGAVIFHVRANDTKNAPVPAAIGALALGILILHLSK